MPHFKENFIFFVSPQGGGMEFYMSLKQESISDLIPLLKEKGYRKNRQNWYKEDDDLIILVNIRNSCYDKDGFYVNLGIIIKELTTEKSGICLSGCHLQQRIEAKK